MTYRIIKKLKSGLKDTRLGRFATRAEAQAEADKHDGYEPEFVTPKGFRAISWCFDDGIVRTGYTDNSTWNGFTNVWVLPEVRDEIDEETLTHEPIDANGLVSLAYGYATTEIEVS